MKIFTVVGTRPNFVKIDPKLPNQVVVNTNQHYDYLMAGSFFKELDLPKPKFNLNCKSSEIGKMIDKLSKLFAKEKPDMVIVFGDTNSSLAGALAAAYQQITIVHIEAGLRSNNRKMPEEINRMLIDKLATLRLCPNFYSEKNLISEGLTTNNYVVGDPMFDTMLRFIPIKKTKDWHKYILVTLHRNINVDVKENLESILDALAESDEKFVLPLHPRTKKNIKTFGLKVPKNVKVTNPQTYKKMLSLISNAKKVVTDSGGVQREAFWFNVPLILLRTETEWLDIVAKGAGILVGTDKDRIKQAIKEFKGAVVAPPEGQVNEKIRNLIYKYG